MTQAPADAKATASSPARPIGRITLAAAIILAVAAYIRAILAGAIPAAAKLGVVELTIILVAGLVVTVLLQPRILDRLSHFKLGSLEIELEKLQQAQQVQVNELNDLRFVLTLLLLPSELRHLRSLQKGGAVNAVGSNALRTELRKLRTMKLIRSCGGKRIGEIADQKSWDLAAFVELTDRGRDYLERLGEEL
jgi:hypothetical protein